MKEYLNSVQFQVGFFIGALLAAILFSVILINWYTSNELLEGIGFYRNGKVYMIIEKSQHRQEQYYEKRR